MVNLSTKELQIKQEQILLWLIGITPKTIIEVEQKL